MFETRNWEQFSEVVKISNGLIGREDLIVLECAEGRTIAQLIEKYSYPEDRLETKTITIDQASWPLRIARSEIYAN